MSDPSTPRGGSNLALIISLCLNFLLAGLIVTAVVRFSMNHPLLASLSGGGLPGRGDGMGRGMWQMEPLSPGAMIQAAPGKAAEIRSIIEAHRPRIHALRMSSFAARDEALRQYTAPKFDRNAFDKSLARIQSDDAALESELLKTVSDSATALTPEERRAAAAAPVQWGPGHGRGHGRGWHRGGGPPMQDGP